ncbi:MFS transporter [Paraburkholderia caballeronis]|uniref:Sugar transporter n=1 Tax=Paraburkholderia caballeronis TaxID=416943 RepID=A0A1H7FN08_9BURK|nr:MFS transporter [Paraburkholderia caballeronis]PXW24911.1 sugar transport protein [Paraburkholderia caballeronis]PXX00641.1 sugar transport protein [Paraburkholderia caballeronis]RAJ98704.1 sugar transport protein [Paraburkholderia caballeronis]SEE70557.1 Sugar transporter [Paraburkholderia caballeronis]SEK27341.1 Sugar transporter [Paraburkholderia caballeronis]
MEQGRIAAGARGRWYDGLTPMHWRVLRASFLGWIFDGYEALVLVVVLAPMLHSVLSATQAASTPIYAGLVIGITLLGWGIGGLVGGILADYVGRKRMMLWSVFLYAVFSGFTAFSTDVWMLCALRFVTGLAMGSEWSTGIALVSETWPEQARAKGAGFLQSGFGWGTLTAAVIWYGLSSVHPFGADTWRLMFVLGAVPALFVLYIRRGVNESEKWQRAVREKRWNATNAEPAAASAAPASGRRPFTLAQLFVEREAARRTLILVVLSIVTTVGWWAISSWLPTFTVALAKAEGLADPVAWGSRVSIVYTVGAIVAYMIAGFVIDAIGRKTFLSLTFVGSLAATFVTYRLTTSVETMMIVAPINGFFTLGCAYVWMAIYPCELFTSTVRSTAISFVFNAARLIAWVFPILAGTMIKSFGGVPQAAMALGSVYVLGIVLPWFLPETRGHGMPD